MKVAIITPILKKPSLDSETLKSYRPMSNVSFLSKLLERIVANRLIAHICENDLYMPLQSAYRQNGSTETALLHVHDSVIRSTDEPKGVRIGNIHVTPNTHARNLGVTFDSNMYHRHETNISRTAYYHLHSIGRIRRYIDQGHKKQLVHALVTSCIDCCNSLLNELSVV